MYRAPYPPPPTQQPKATTRTLRWAVPALAALIIGGLIGGVIGSLTGRQDNAVAVATQSPTTQSTAEPAPITIPTTPDPVCGEWATIGDRGRAERAAWRATDPSIPAADWTASQRALNLNLVPNLLAEAENLRRLAAAASEPLATTLATVATYESAFAKRIPTYNPAIDLPVWRTATEAATLANSLCAVVAR